MTQLLYPFAAIGLIFTLLLLRGLAMNGRKSAISFDQWLGTCLIEGHMPDETISAWAHREQHLRTERFINWIFRDPNHCAKAYASEMEGAHNPSEYRK